MAGSSKTKSSHDHTLFLNTKLDSNGILAGSLSFNAIASKIGFFVSL